MPSGSVSSGSSSSSGSSTKRRLVTSRVREREAVRAVLELAEQQHVHVDRPRPVAQAARLAAEVALDPLAASSSSSGPSAVRIRRAAFRKSGWSVTSPCGAVSYTDDAASTATS